MQRLLSTIRLDLMVQWRNRLYIIGIGVALAMGVGLRLAFSYDQMRQVLPLFFLLGVGGTAMLYLLGLVIFEKDEGTLEAQSVSPLSTHEYLMGKIVTLSFLSVVEGVIVTLVAYGWQGYNVGWLLLGLIVMAIMFVLAGFIVIVRYNSLTDAFLPMLPIGLIAEFPLLHFVGVGDSPVWYLIPTMAPTLMLWQAWNSISQWDMVYAFGYSLLAIAGMYVWAFRDFHHYIVQRGRVV